MYRIEKHEQLSIEEFKLPFEGKLDPENRWVEKLRMIPWETLERQYSRHFCAEKMGSPAKPVRMAFGALVIQATLNLSDAETVAQIRENPYMQYFIGLPAFQQKDPFDASLMVYFRKRITVDMINEINEEMFRAASQTAIEAEKAQKKRKKQDPPDDTDSSGPTYRQGTLILDATCAPQDIRYPTDLDLLNESRQWLEQLIERLCISTKQPLPRRYSRQARRDYLSVIRRKVKSERLLRSAIRKQLQYIRRDIGYIETLLGAQGRLSEREWERYETIVTIFRQQERMYRHRTHSIAERIVSVSQPHVRPIVRNKARAKCEFGAKLSLSSVSGYCFVDHISWESYNEATLFQQHVEHYQQAYGYYPEVVCADQIYRNRENRAYCKERGIRMAGKALGRPKKMSAAEKKESRQSEGKRNRIEGAFGVAKNRFGLNLIRTKRKAISESAIALIVFAMNLEHRLRVLFLRVWNYVILFLKHYVFEDSSWLNYSLSTQFCMDY